MDISILDFGGNFAGTALGLSAHGHEVSYYSTPVVDAGESLLGRSGCQVEEPSFDGDLVLVAASFADEAWALELGIQHDAPVAPDDPLFFSINPLQRRVRDAWLEPRLQAIRSRLALVDMSDCGEVLDPFFARHGRWKFKRELPAYGLEVPHGEAAITEFPFLYNKLLLNAEWTVGLDQFAVTREERQSQKELLFAGTVDHWRYFGRRRTLLHRFQERYPDAPVDVVTGGMTSREVWTALQRARAGLYLPGRGELCFRLHECAAFGVPLVMADEPTIRIPPAWRAVLPTDPSRICTPAAMLDFYREHYHPVRAAQYLLDRLSPTAGPIKPKVTTSA